MSAATLPLLQLRVYLTLVNVQIQVVIYFPIISQNVVVEYSLLLFIHVFLKLLTKNIHFKMINTFLIFTTTNIFGYVD